MSFLDVLMNRTVGISCGLCCTQNVPCDKCLEDTLRANGIDLKFIEKFRGLKNKNTSYSWPFEYSELCLALKKHKEEEEDSK